MFELYKLRIWSIHPSLLRDVTLPRPPFKGEIKITFSQSYNEEWVQEENKIYLTSVSLLYTSRAISSVTAQVSPAFTLEICGEIR
jgi:hypothetical protein